MKKFLIALTELRTRAFNAVFLCAEHDIAICVSFGSNCIKVSLDRRVIELCIRKGSGAWIIYKIIRRGKAILKSNYA